MGEVVTVLVVERRVVAQGHYLYELFLNKTLPSFLRVRRVRALYSTVNGLGGFARCSLGGTGSAGGEGALEINLTNSSALPGVF